MTAATTAARTINVTGGVASAAIMVNPKSKCPNAINAVENDINPYDNITGCTNDAYFYNDTTTGGGLKPGAMTRVYLAFSLSTGVPNGSLSQSLLTVRATD